MRPQLDLPPRRPLNKRGPRARSRAMRARIATSVSAQTDWSYGNMRTSPVLQPISDVISQRADDANCKPGPQDAEQQHGIGAFHKFLVDQMGHKLPLFESPPFPRRKCNA